MQKRKNRSPSSLTWIPVSKYRYQTEQRYGNQVLHKKALWFYKAKKQFCRSAWVSMQIKIRIQLFIPKRIRIQGAKPMRIHADPDGGHWSVFAAVTKSWIFTWKIYLTSIICQFPCSWFQIRILESRINEDPCGSRSETQLGKIGTVWSASLLCE